MFLQPTEVYMWLNVLLIFNIRTHGELSKKVNTRSSNSHVTINNSLENESNGQVTNDNNHRISNNTINNNKSHSTPAKHKDSVNTMTLIQY